jgi:Multicopper oxidase
VTTTRTYLSFSHPKIMRTKTETSMNMPRNIQRLIAATTIAAFVSTLTIGIGSTPASAQATAAGPLATTCALTTDATPTYDCHLWAQSASVNIGAAANVNVRSYTGGATSTSLTSAIGPTLVVEQGKPVSITLHNALGVDTSLVIPAIVGFTALDAPTTNPTATRVLPTLGAGTYLYEAADPRQVATGMVGALIVKPIGGLTAYAGKDSFNDEATLVLTEIDDAFSANPNTASLRSWRPKYQLINGKMAPATGAINTVVGNKVLLRYVNGGLVNHTMGVLGTRQVVIGADARATKHNESVVALTIRPGQSMDALVTMPNITNVPVYETTTTAGMSILLRAIGGVAGVTTTTGATTTTSTTTTIVTLPTAPTVTTMAVAPSPVGPGQASTLAGTITGTSVDGYRYSIDGATPVVVAVTSAASVSVSVPLVLTGLANGAHTLTLAGRSGADWGADVVRTLTIDALAPVVSAYTATVNATNTALGVAFTATDSATGGANVDAAQYALVSGTGVAPAAGTAIAFTAAASVNVIQSVPVTDGTYTLYVRARDARGNWSAWSSASVFVDANGPAASLGTTDPLATNGVQASPQTPAGSVAVNARLTDLASNVVAAEMFTGATAPTNAALFGTGIVGSPTTGVFDALTEDVTILAPISSLAAPTFQGTVNFWVHGKDARGNWGPFLNVAFVIDRTAPTTTAASLTPILLGGTSTTLSLTASDPVSGTVSTGVRQGEWFEGTDPGLGRAAFFATTGASPYSIPLTMPSTLTIGVHTIVVRVIDKAGNWSANRNVTLTVTGPNAIFSDTFTGALAASWIASGTPSVVGDKLSIPAAPAAGSSVRDTSPAGEASYHASFDVTPGALRGSNVNPMDLFVGYSTDAGTNASAIFRIQYRRNPNTAVGVPQIRVVVRTTGTNVTNGAWINMPGGAGLTTVRLDWLSAAANVNNVVLTLNGTVVASALGTPNTTSSKLQSVALGLVSGGAAIQAGTGPLLIDNFVSTRNTLP